MELDFFGLFSVNALYIILAILVMTIVSVSLSGAALHKLGTMKKKYNRFMMGKEAESLEEVMLSRFEEIDKLKSITVKHTKDIEEITEKFQFVYKKAGIVKYDAFNEMGGKLSFALVMLDARDNGFVINSMHSREGCYTYIKEIVRGQSYIDLGEEERKALDQALAGEGDVDLGELNNKLK